MDDKSRETGHLMLITPERVFDLETSTETRPL